MLNQRKYGDYKLIKKIGEGAYGNVYIGQKDQDNYALKFIDKDLIIEEDLADNIKTELNLMKAIKHPYIVELKEILSSAQKIILVMEYVDGGDLFDEIKRGRNERLSEDLSRKYFQQIISALEYCHNKNVIHRDLKPENILFDEKQKCIKISDFGLATMLKEKDEKLSDFCGTTNYLAPEIIKETGKIFSSGGYSGQPADIWSSGVILYNMVSGENPFYHSDKAININNILNANIDYPDYFSEGLIDLLKKIFITQPKLRYNIESIKKHPWFTKNLKANNIYFNCISSPTIGDEILDSDFKLNANKDDIPYANCFVITSILSGKWVSNIFRENNNNGINKNSGIDNSNSSFDNKDNYEFYATTPCEKLVDNINDYFSNFQKITFNRIGKGIWKIETKMDSSSNNIFNMMIYKISNNIKYIILFEHKEGNKATFAKIIKNFYDNKKNLFHKF